MYLSLLISVFIALTTIVSFSDEVSIASFDSNGQLTWTSSLTGGFFKVEWSPKLDSEWRSEFRYDKVINTSSTHSVQIPMHYRVSWYKGISIYGAVYYSTNTLINSKISLQTFDGCRWILSDETYSDEDGRYRFEGLSDGVYMVSTTGEGLNSGEFNGVGYEVEVSGEDVEQDLRALKRVYAINPARESIVSSTNVFFSWDSVNEATYHSLWIVMGNNDNYGEEEFRATALITNTYFASLTLTNGPYSWGVDLYDRENNQVAFGNDFDFILQAP